jgi:hypothetical protein
VRKFLHAARVGQGREKQICFFQILHAAKLQGRAFAKIGMLARDGFADKSFRGALRNLNLGVLQQQAQQFPAAITGCTDNAYFHFLATSST